jgi:hypothetical protein
MFSIRTLMLVIAYAAVVLALGLHPPRLFPEPPPKTRISSSPRTSREVLERFPLLNPRASRTDFYP